MGLLTQQQLEDELDYLTMLEDELQWDIDESERSLLKVEERIRVVKTELLDRFNYEV